MDQAAWAARIRAQMNFEWQREGPPDGFPELPPLPTGRYTDPAFYALEREHIWKKSWLLVGRDEDFDGPGSFRTCDRTGSPLLVVGGNDLVLRGFFNTCQHRGAPVVRDACGTAKRLRCQYHSWTYDLDGSLLQVPDRRDFTVLDESARSLKPVRCEERVPGLDPLFSDTNPAYSLFPNLITPLDTIGFPFILFWPIDAETTEVEWTFYGPPPETPDEVPSHRAGDGRRRDDSRSSRRLPLLRHCAWNCSANAAPEARPKSGPAYGGQEAGAEQAPSDSTTAAMTAASQTFL